MPIRVLDAAIVGRIAAGEVVERPSSVVKELMENSIDAGATAITVEIKGGGIDYLRVTDNGCGIEPSQVKLAFENHATSKLQNADQLNDIRTLGFRGEALPSIASVSHVEMTTRAHGQVTGIKLNIDGGQDLRTSPVGCPEGTTFVMRELFYNLPVRRAFLKKPTYEGGLVGDAVARIIMGNPGISIRYISNGSTIYHSFGDGKLRHAVYTVYGKDTAEKMIEVDASQGGTRLFGLIGIGELAKPTRAHQAFFINGRSVRCPLLSKALEEVCRSRVTIGMYPMCALNIVIPPSSVDVNVHPNKLEVRFRDEALMRTIAEQLLASAFEGEHVLDFNCAQWSAKSMERVTTVRKVETVPIKPDEEKKKARPSDTNNSLSAAELPSELTDGPGRNDNAFPGSSASIPDSMDQMAEIRTLNRNDADRYVVRQEKPVQLNAFQRAVTDALVQLTQTDGDVLKERSTDTLDGIPIPTISLRSSLSSELKRTKQEPEKELVKEAGNASEMVSSQVGNDNQTGTATEPKGYRVIGVLLRTYILIEANDALVMIDQHAAHERLRYEKYLEQLEQGQGSQQLLAPMILHLSAREMALVQDNLEVLDAAGYEIEGFGEQDIQVRAVPFILGKADPRPVFMDVINSLNRVRSASIELRRAEIMQMSCKGAVKGGDTLSDSEISVLIKQLMETDAPPTCPHGRPVARVITRRELEKMFKRIQ